ncbi:MAG: alpha/beta hydrolase [Deltaproteobacteria bacterium]|nr:alpha/beta hydrolase [Deltaproteobacteria bacterium]
MGCLFYPWIESYFVFFPDRSFEATPADWRLNGEDVYFETADGTRIHGWFFPLPGDPPVILFSHGNAGNISHRLENVKLLVSRGLSVFIYDYRGYGRSHGRPSEKGIYQDGLAAYDWLTVCRKIGPDRIVSFGRSLGAAVAIEIAARRRVRALIVESAFTSTRDMARQMFLFGFLAPLLPAHYNNLAKIQGIHAPKLIVHGKADEIVPFTMGRALYLAAPGPKFHYWIPGAGHNDTYLVAGRNYGDVFLRFVSELTELREKIMS